MECENDICLIELKDQINFATEIAEPACVAESGDVISPSSIDIT